MEATFSFLAIYTDDGYVCTIKINNDSLEDLKRIVESFGGRWIVVDEDMDDRE